MKKNQVVMSNPLNNTYTSAVNSFLSNQNPQETNNTANRVSAACSETFENLSQNRQTPNSEFIPTTSKKGKISLKSELSENEMILNDLNSWVDQTPENAIQSRSRVRQRMMNFLCQQRGELDLSSCALGELPDIFGYASVYTKLKCLNLDKNDLTSIPETIGNLTQLTTLNLSENQLTVIPETIGSLTRLTTLWLYNNPLTVIPETIGNLTQLTRLYLHNNQLTAIPETIGNLTQLTILYLSANHSLIGLPEQILELPRTCIVSVEETGLSESVLSRLREATRSENYRGPRFSFSINEHAENEDKPTEQVLTEMYELAGKEIPDVYPDLTGKVNEEQLNAWLNRISFIADYKSGGDRQKVIVSKVIDYLEKAEKDPQFAEAFGMTIADAAETCGDRVALSIIHVGIAYKLANFDLKAMDALGEYLVRNVWAIELLEGCARDKIPTLRLFDEIEVYLGYVMKLKDELKLSIDVEDMLYFGCSSLSEDDLSKAKDFVLEKMNSEEKFRFLIKNEKWLNALELNYGEQMEQINKQRYEDLEKNPQTWEQNYDASLIELSKSIYHNSITASTASLE